MICAKPQAVTGACCILTGLTGLSTMASGPGVFELSDVHDEHASIHTSVQTSIQMSKAGVGGPQIKRRLYSPVSHRSH